MTALIKFLIKGDFLGQPTRYTNTSLPIPSQLSMPSAAFYIRSTDAIQRKQQEPGSSP